MKKVALIIVLFAIPAVLLFSACGTDTGDEPCGYCGETPTKGYKTSNDEVFYACESCSSECAFCGSEAKKHYTFEDFEMFVCTDCYRAMKK